MWGKIVVVLVSVLILSNSVQAQVDQEIPACTPNDLTEMLTVFAEKDVLPSLGRLAAITQNPTAFGDRNSIVEIDSFQRKWWGDIVPELPRCALATDFILLVGRLMDESLISLLSLRLLELDMAEYHVDQIAEVSHSINELTEQLRN